jgi:hypothetical protein
VQTDQHARDLRRVQLAVDQRASRVRIFNLHFDARRPSGVSLIRDHVPAPADHDRRAATIFFDPL